MTDLVVLDIFVVLTLLSLAVFQLKSTTLQIWIDVLHIGRVIAKTCCWRDFNVWLACFEESQMYVSIYSIVVLFCFPVIVKLYHGQ